MLSNIFLLLAPRALNLIRLGRPWLQLSVEDFVCVRMCVVLTRSMHTHFVLIGLTRFFFVLNKGIKKEPHNVII